MPQLVSIEGRSLIRTFSVEYHTKMRVCFSDEQTRRTFGFCFPKLLFHNREFSECVYMEILMYFCAQN